MIRAHWENSSTDGFSVCLRGWAFTDVEGPLEVTVVDGEYEERPSEFGTFERSDVATMFPGAPVNCGIVLTLSLEKFITLQPKSLAWRVMDSDGKEQRVKPQANDAVWNALCFSDYDTFSRNIQNPAFRHKDPNVQNFGALLAYQRKDADLILRVAALVVILYRFITSEIKDIRIKNYCHQYALAEYHSFHYSHGLEFRWKVSLGMAIGYFMLLDGRSGEAAEVFSDIAAMHFSLPVWPAMATNVVTASLLASTLRQKKEDLELLGNVPAILRMTVKNAPLTNFYQYEEHINLIRVAAQCAVQHAVASKQGDWIGPIDLSIDQLSHIPKPVREVLKDMRMKKS